MGEKKDISDIENMKEDIPSKDVNQKDNLPLDLSPSGIVICNDSTLRGMKRVHESTSLDSDKEHILVAPFGLLEEDL